jgi:hypothetical protein
MEKEIRDKVAIQEMIRRVWDEAFKEGKRAAREEITHDRLVNQYIKELIQEVVENG